MFLKSKRLIKKISFFVTFLCLSNAITINAYASSFTEISYENAYNYTELENRIVAESSTQSLNFFEMTSKWNAFGTTQKEQYDDLSTYIEDAKTRYSFISNYNGSLSDEIKLSYKNYISWMESSLQGDIASLVNGPTIFIDYIEKNMSDTQTNYLSFKTDGLDKFLNSYIYTNNNKSAVTKIANGPSSEKENGRQELQNTINSLEEIRTKTNGGNYVAPTIIRNYAEAYENYYRQVLNGDFSHSSELLQFKLYKIDGMIPIGQANDELIEFNAYSALFNQFTDYSTLELAIKVSPSKIKKDVQLINEQAVKTKKVQQLKKTQYEFLYQLSEYKDTKDMDSLERAYRNFDRTYAYVKEYYSKINSRYNGFSSSTVIQDIQLLKEQAKCINPNLSFINDLEYTSLGQKDTTSYRIFSVNSDWNMVQIFKIICVLFLIILASLIIVFFVIRVKNHIREQRESLDEDDDYYY